MKATKVELNIDLAMKLGLLRLRCSRCNTPLQRAYEEYYYCRNEDCDYGVQVSDDWVIVGEV